MEWPEIGDPEDDSSSQIGGSEIKTKVHVAVKWKVKM